MLYEFKKYASFSRDDNSSLKNPNQLIVNLINLISYS